MYCVVSCYTLDHSEISLTPSYAAVVGAGWMEKGGCYVTANIRGGGEFGPQWHQSAKKENRYCVVSISNYKITALFI